MKTPSHLDLAVSSDLEGTPRPALRARWLDARRELLLCLGLVVAALTVYARVWNYQFISIDDPLYIGHNPYVRSGLSFAGIRWAFTQPFLFNWTPLTLLSLMLDTTIYGVWAGGYHITNVIFHVANVLLVFALFKKATGNTLRSAFVAALFAIHPVHVESVAWISERKDVLSQFFGLLSIWAYVRFGQERWLARTEARRWAWLCLSLVLMVCSLLSKQTLVTLPFVLLLLDYWPLDRLNRATFSRLLLEKLPFLIVSAAFCGAAIWAQSQSGSIRSLAELPLLTRYLNAILAYGLYLRRAVLPFDLAAFYPHPGADISLTAAMLSLGVLIAISACAIVNARRWPFLLVGWFWFLGTLVPMIGLVHVGAQQMADRYTYFPLLGCYLLIAWLVPELLAGRVTIQRLTPWLATGTIVAYAAIAIVQVGYWRDGVTLMRHSLAVTEDNPFARAALGDALLGESRTDEAIEQFRYAVRIAPDDPDSYIRLGDFLKFLGRYVEAADQYRAALAIEETEAGTHIRLGEVLLELRHFEEARHEFYRVIELDRDQARAYANLAIIAWLVGDTDESAANSRRAIELDDRQLVCHRLLGRALAEQGRLDEAVQQLRHGLALSPGDTGMADDLAQIEAGIYR